MKRMIVATFLAIVLPGATQAQVFIRAPFVRVGVGGPGVSVRAPFVNIYIPRSTPAYYPAPGYYAPGYYGPGYGGSGMVIPRHYSSDYTLPPLEPRFVPAEPRFVPGSLPESDPGVIPSTAKTIERPSATIPSEPKGFEAPEPRAAVDGMTIDEFVKTFKPRAGNYELDLINPVTKKATNVRFSLPEGMVTSVQIKGAMIEFRYGPMSYVRIAFDKDGAEISSR